MGQLNPFELIQTLSAAAAACAARGLSQSVANLALFASFAIFYVTADNLHAIFTYTCNQDRFSTSFGGILIFLVSTFLFTISRWQLPLLQMQLLLACPKR